MQDLTQLSEQLRKIIAASYQIGHNDGTIQDMAKAKLTDEQIVEYLNNIINQEQNA